MNGLPPINVDEFDRPIERAPLFADRLLTIGLNALSGRALVWAAFLGAVALWTLAMLDPSVLKTCVAVGYCLTTLTPILLRDAKGR